MVELSVSRYRNVIIRDRWAAFYTLSLPGTVPAAALSQLRISSPQDRGNADQDSDIIERRADN